MKPEIFGLKIKKNDGSTIYAEGTMEEMLEAIRKESKGIRSITMQRVGWISDEYIICNACFENMEKYCREHKEGKK